MFKKKTPRLENANFNPTAIVQILLCKIRCSNIITGVVTSIHPVDWDVKTHPVNP